MTADDLQRLALGDKELSFALGTLLAYHRQLFPDAKNCQSPDCVNRIRKEDCDPTNGHYDCSFCGSSHCFACGAYHKGISCEKYLEDQKGDVAFQAILHDPRSWIHPCPYCYAPIQKSMACDHMTCTSCKNKFDWRLGRISDAPVHYSEAHQEARTYRIPGDVNQKTGERYSEYKEDVGNDYDK